MTTPSPGMPYFIVPTSIGRVGNTPSSGPFSKSGWVIAQPKNNAQLTQWLVAGYLGPYKTMADAQARFRTGNFQTPTQVKKQTQKQQSGGPIPLPDPLGNWLRSLAGEIGSGIEGAFVALLKDLWDVILGPLEIIAGALVAFVIIAYIFKDDLAAVAPMIIAALA